MWSHTIQSSKPKIQATPKSIANKPSSVDDVEEEDMTQNYGADGFSKTSRVHTSKKPLTVAKAPTLGRTTSRADRLPTTPTTPKEDVRPTLEKRASRLTPASTAKGGTPSRPKKDVQPPAAGARTRAPVASKHKTTDQNGRISRASTPAQDRPAGKDPKLPASPRRRAGTSSSTVTAAPATPTNENVHEQSAIIDTAANSNDSLQKDPDRSVETDGTKDKGLPVEIQEKSRVPDEPKRETLQAANENEHREQDDDTNHDIHGKLNREITLRNVTIKRLREELQKSQTVHEQTFDKLQLEALAQEQTLRSELNSVRATLVDLDDSHRLSSEKHDSLLRSRDKIIQNLSTEVSDFRDKLEVAEKIKQQIAQDLERKLQKTDQVEDADRGHDDIVLSKEEEIRSLTEDLQDLKKQLEAADTARAKEIYDELLRSKDKEIEDVSKVAHGLRGELKGSSTAARSSGQDKLLRSKDEEIKSLTKTVQSLREKLESNDRAKEQEVNHSVSSLRDEFQDLQNKHKRKIEDLQNAASARVESLQLEFDELLGSRDQEIKDMAELVQGLQQEIETAQTNQKQELQRANLDHEQQLQDFKVMYEKASEDVKSEHERQVDVMSASIEESKSRHHSELNEISRKHRHELDSIAVEQQNVVASKQQQVREAKREHDQAVENMRSIHRSELQAAKDDLGREIEALRSEHEQKLRDAVLENDQKSQEAVNEHKRKVEDLELKIREEQDSASKYERLLEEERANHKQDLEQEAQKSTQELREAAQQHERDLEEASAKYQRELADVDKLRGDSTQDIFQKHEDQLKSIAGKYQQELAEATQKHETTVSQHVKDLEEASASGKDADAKVHDLEQRLEEVSAKRTDADAQVQSVQRKLEEVSARRMDADAQVQSLQEDIEEKRQKLEAIAIEKANQDGEIQDLVVNHRKEMEELITKYQQELDQASTKYEHFLASNLQQSQEHQGRIADLESDLEKALAQVAARATEAASLKATLKENEDRIDSNSENVKLEHQKALDEAGSIHTTELIALQAQLQSHADEISRLHADLSSIETSKKEETENLVLQSERAMRDALAEHEKDIGEIREERDLAIQELSSLKIQVQDMSSAIHEEFEEVNSLKQDLNDADLARKEATVELTLVKDKLELKTREGEREAERLASLQVELESLQGRMLESEDDFTRERNEVAVEIALLKDRLELAELQKQSAAEDTSLSQNEANIEIALLKDKLELAELQSRGDKQMISSLNDRLAEVQAKAPDTKPYLHHQLRQEMAMLARHHAANMADVAALKESILKEREVREEEWRKRAEGRDALAKDLYGIGAELNGITGVH